MGGNGAGVRIDVGIYKTVLSDQLRSWFIALGKPHRQCGATHCGCVSILHCGQQDMLALSQNQIEVRSVVAL